MMLAAVELGIGSGRSAVRDQAQAQRVLGVPDGHCCVYLVALGFRAGPSTPSRSSTADRSTMSFIWGRLRGASRVACAVDARVMSTVDGPFAREDGHRRTGDVVDVSVPIDERRAGRRAIRCVRFRAG